MTPRRVLPLLVAALSFTVCAGAPAAGQEERGAARVDMPQSVGPAAGTVAVPIQLSSGGSKIGTLTLRLSFPASQLTFDRVEIGGLGEAVGAQATVKADAAGDDTRLDITIAAGVKDGARQPLLDGPIAHVMFTLAAHLKSETVVPIAAKASATAATSRAEPVGIRTADTEVIVSDATVVGCFFYIH
jgi:hypothetical protein